MKLILAVTTVAIFGLCKVTHALPRDLDPMDDMDENQFIEHFHLKKIQDKAEFERRQKALKQNEEEVKKVNADYAEGKKTWHDAVNKLSDLPADEFVQKKTGMKKTYATGMLEPLPEQRIDEASERYFDQLRMSRSSVPSSYSSVDEGIVSPVKDQKDCGSCVAFAAMSAIETCFKKLTGAFGDYSEQQMVDCAFGIYGAKGCNGAPPHAYLMWAGKNKIEFAAESQYPYLNMWPKLECPSDISVYNQGARVSGLYYTYYGDEELLKKLVYENGAVSAGVYASGGLQDYEGGIFAGCAPDAKTNHAISVVGYGTENGVDYWLIKNSWGTDWGENGFFRLQRGVGMCGIGSALITTECEATSGPTDPPPPPPPACVDQDDECQYYGAQFCSREQVRSICPASCDAC